MHGVISLTALGTPLVQNRRDTFANKAGMPNALVHGLWTNGIACPLQGLKIPLA